MLQAFTLAQDGKVELLQVLEPHSLHNGCQLDLRVCRQQHEQSCNMSYCTCNCLDVQWLDFQLQKTSPGFRAKN